MRKTLFAPAALAVAALALAGCSSDDGGSTGTDDGALGPVGGYDQYDQPAVWRSPRGNAADHVRALEDSGVERFDIPAFLRKQAD